MKNNFEEFFTIISKGIMLKYGLWALTGLQLRLTYRVCYFVRLTTISYISKENTSKVIFQPTIDNTKQTYASGTMYKKYILCR